MPTVSESIVINTDRATLWSLLTTPAQILQWFEGMHKLEANGNYPEPGSALDLTYKVAGIDIHSTVTVTAMTPQREVHLKLGGLVSGSQEWVIGDASGGLKLNVYTDYKIGAGALGKLAEPAVHQMNVSNAKKSLAKIKQMAEAK